MFSELYPDIFEDSHLVSLKNYSLSECVKTFKAKGGVLNVPRILQEGLKSSISLQESDAVYPICSGAICRSQVLYYVLNEIFSKKNLYIFPPHASRWGYDPYYDEIPTQKKISPQDEFELAFGQERIQPFGYKEIENKLQSRINENKLEFLKSFYNHAYYGPESNLEGKKGKRRVYIAFAKPVHAVIKRLIETNQHLQHITVVAIPLKDEITHPPQFLGFKSCSVQAYLRFKNILKALFTYGC